MAKKKPQLPLFAVPGIEPVDDPAVAAIAARLPAGVRLGPSSWSFPGWSEIVYRGAPSKEALVDGGLAACARYPLFGTVSVDQSYYAPLPREKWREYADAMPAGFVATAKMWAEVTRKYLPNLPRLGALAGQPNPHYLDVEIARAFVEDYVAGLGEKAGPILLQFPPMPAPSSPIFCAELADFLQELPTSAKYAVEIRNRELFTPRYARTLRDLGVAHTFTFWSGMPPLDSQMQASDLLEAPFVMARLNLAPGMEYEERKQSFAPFDRLQVVQPQMRADVVELQRRSAGKPMFIVANNKAEGCAPLTLRAIAEKMIAD